MPKVKRKLMITKRLQTELQCTIAFACYDSDKVLKAGDSATQKNVEQKIFDMYQPVKSPEGDNGIYSDNMSHVELMCEGEGVYKYLFEREYNRDTSRSVSSASRESITSSRYTLYLPENLHCRPNEIIKVGKNGINMALLTRKNLTNYVDISPATLWRHAKDVEANFKKAYALCKADDSPYKDYDGTFPSGHNRDSYLEWLRNRLNGEFGKLILEDNIDEDIIPDSGAENNDDIENVDDITVDEEKKTEYKDAYFKGYFAFALWGYIPPVGGEEMKSSVILTCENPERAKGKDGGRKATKKRKADKERKTSEDEYRGSPRGIESEEKEMKSLQNLILKGRKESDMQRLFKSRTDKIEFGIKFHANRITEIREEILELKEEGLGADDDEIIALKSELKNTRKKKKELFDRWNKVSDEEESRRETRHKEIVVLPGKKTKEKTM